VAKAGSTATSITLGWSPASDNTGVAGYGLYIGSIHVATTALTSHVFGALACGATHSLGVDAVDAAGNRSARVTISASTNACPSTPVDSTPPSAPGGLAVGAIDETSISVAWSASSDNVAVTGYSLYRNGVLVASIGSTSSTFAGLTCGTSYTLGLDAYDAAGNRSARTTVTGATAVCPPSPPPSGGADLYVSSAGSDSGSCSALAPCRGFDRAYRVAQPGEVVEVAAGSYGSQSIGKDSAKTSAADVLFRPAPGATVTLGSLSISGSHVEVRDMRLTTDGSVGSNPIDTRDVTLRNLTGRSLFLRADDVLIAGGSYGGFNGCDSGAPEDGVKLWSDSNRGADGIVLDGVRIHDIRRTGCDRHTDCIQIYSGTNHTIKNSTLVNCPTTGIIARPSGSSQKLENITIENNYFGPVLDGSEAINIGTAPDRCSGIVIRHNTVVDDSSSFDCRTAGGAAGSLVEGNIIRVGGDDDAVFRFNVFRPGSARPGVGAVSCSPAYRNAAAGDWRLAVGDRCARGRGNPSSHPATDAEGEPRPQGAVDAGADEIR
jgi:chitodextrinase